MSTQTKAMLRSWANVFIAAVITALLVILTSNSGSIPLDGETWLSVLIAGLVAVLPVVKNYFDPNDPRYGKADDRVASDTE